MAAAARKERLQSVAPVEEQVENVHCEALPVLPGQRHAGVRGYSGSWKEVIIRVVVVHTSKGSGSVGLAIMRLHERGVAIMPACRAPGRTASPAAPAAVPRDTCSITARCSGRHGRPSHQPPPASGGAHHDSIPPAPPPPSPSVAPAAATTIMHPGRHPLPGCTQLPPPGAHLQHAQ